MTKVGKGESPMDAALAYLGAKPRTERELERHLDSKNYGEYEVYQVVERLKELGYIGDEKYAEDFVSTRLASKPVSRRKLKDQLYRHELPKDIIENALSSVTDETEMKNALDVAQKYARQFAALADKERKARTAKRLVTRGFDYDVVAEALRTVFGSADDVDINMDIDMDMDMTDIEDD